MSSTTLFPLMYWAQRNDKVILTADIPDSSKVKIDIKNKSLYIAAIGGHEKNQYEAQLNLFDEVNEEESKYSVNARNISFVLMKKEKKWWDRLIEEKIKNRNIQVDWDKWVDEEDEGEDEFDMSAFQNIPGAAEGSDSEDSEDLEDLQVDKKPEAEGEESKPEEAAATEEKTE